MTTAEVLAPRRRGVAPALPVPRRTRLRPVPASGRRELALRRRRRRLLALGTVFVTGVLFAIAVIHVGIAESAFRLQHERQLLQDDWALNDQLRVLVAQAAAPARVREVAMRDLGMVEPGVIRYVTVGEVEQRDDLDQGALAANEPAVGSTNGRRARSGDADAIDGHVDGVDQQVGPVDVRPTAAIPPTR